MTGPNCLPSCNARLKRLRGGCVRATSELLLTGEVSFPPIQLLLVADAIYLIVSFVSFEYVLDE